MILHIFSDSPYTFRFIDLVLKMFNPADHHFIVYLDKSSRFTTYYSKIVNCDLAYSQLDFFKSADKFIKAEKIIIHQLNLPRLLLFISIFYPSALKKSIWSIWGADAYFHIFRTDSIKDKLMEKIFSHSIKHFSAIVSMIPGDFDVVKNKYETGAKYFHAYYPSPIDLASIGETKLREKDNNTKIIMVGNSCDPANQHIDALKLLSRYKDYDIKVVVVLSYSGDNEYLKSVIAFGRQTFGCKFLPITDYMSFDDYLKFVSSVDICVFNHRHQQGLGNMFLFLYLKSKLFISKRTTPLDYFRSIGIELFATEDIEHMSFDSFCKLSCHSRQVNFDIISNELSLSHIRNEWEAVFNATRQFTGDI